MSSRTLSRAQLILAWLTITLLCSCSDQSDPSAASPTVTPQGDSAAEPTFLEMTTAAHFMTPDGASIVVEPGIYQADLIGTSLQLLPDDDGPAILIAVETLAHDEEMDEPIAAAYAGETDEDGDIVEIALLLPDGTYLSAMGSISGVKSRGRKERKANRLAMRQQNHKRRLDNRAVRQANRDKPGVHIGENLANRRDVFKDNKDNRQDTRKDNRENRKKDWGIGRDKNNIPPYRAGRNAFDDFEYMAKGESEVNTYLLNYLATLVYPDYLVEIDPNSDPRGLCQGGDCKSCIAKMHAKGADHFHGGNALFLDNFYKLTQQLFRGKSEYTWLHGYENRAIIYQNKSNLNFDPEAMVISTPSAVFVVFRGTDVLDGAGDQEEWISTNIDFIPIVPDAGLPGTVPRGFWNSLKAPAKEYKITQVKSSCDDDPPKAWPVAKYTGEFREKLANQIVGYGGGTKPIWITGHSLGGAHAQLFAAFLTGKGIKVQGVHAFESPKIGDEIFVNSLNAHFENRIQRFEFRSDPVTKLPDYLGVDYLGAGAQIFARSVHNVGFYAYDMPKARAQPVGSVCFHYPHWGVVAAYNQLSDGQQNKMPSHLGTPWTKLITPSGWAGFLGCNIKNIRLGNGVG